LSVTDPPGAAPARRQLRLITSLWPYIARHPGMVLAALAALVASAGAMLAVPVAVRGMVDFGFSGGVAIDGYFAVLIAIGLVLATASAARMYAVNWLGERVVADLRSEVFSHLATLGPAFYETTHSGEVMSRLTADTTQIKAAAGSALSQALRNLIMLAGAASAPGGRREGRLIATPTYQLRRAQIRRSYPGSWRMLTK
jgi:ATP-binding cassette subfamily B protein